MLPHLRNRPLALERYPDGVDQPGFFQKNAPSYYPRWIPNEPEDGVPPDQQLGRGKIDMVLHGQRLRGGFTLIRTRQRSTGPRPRERWLLVKHRDEYADASWEIDSPELDRSVLTGRMLKQIESGRPGRKR